MATRTSAEVRQSADQMAQMHQWTGLLNGDDGSWVTVMGFTDLTAIASNTFGVGGSVAIEGTMILTGTPAASEIFACRSPSETVIALVSASPSRQVLEGPFRIRPRVTAGDGTTNLTVTIRAKASARVA